MSKRKPLDWGKDMPAEQIWASWVQDTSANLQKVLGSRIRPEAVVEVESAAI